MQNNVKAGASENVDVDDESPQAIDVLTFRHPRLARFVGAALKRGGVDGKRCEENEEARLERNRLSPCFRRHQRRCFYSHTYTFTQRAFLHIAHALRKPPFAPFGTESTVFPISE
ncbi:unnamed protein product [Strongylus vulgaris]|uniref:Uncharacterized protein n=1 Tax=Strongylus vulgaris TaxID=40348 RepID=A0A3P7K2Z2_STRVU|nr:unnamed protein product [Strongylus vulgaris]